MWKPPPRPSMPDSMALVLGIVGPQASCPHYQKALSVLSTRSLPVRPSPGCNRAITKKLKWEPLKTQSPCKSNFFNMRAMANIACYLTYCIQCLLRLAVYWQPCSVVGVMLSTSFPFPLPSRRLSLSSPCIGLLINHLWLSTVPCTSPCHGMLHPLRSFVNNYTPIVLQCD
jgi:hypothetical protein